MSTDKCPKCGAAVVAPQVSPTDKLFVRYECGSYEGETLHRTTECRWRVKNVLPLEEKLQRARPEIEAVIRNLYDRYCTKCGSPCSTGPCEIRRFIAALRDLCGKESEGKS